MDAKGGGEVLVLVDDPALLHSIRRVAAAADRALNEVDVADARHVWGSAPIVVLDARAAAACRNRLPRRRRVVLLCDGPPGIDEWRIATAVGAEHVLAVPEDESALVAVLGEQPQRPEADGTVVAVVGGCGGAGASTLAAATALAAAWRPRPTLLLDTDSWGSGLDVLLGIEDVPGLRWSGLSIEGGRISSGALRDALPACGEWLRVLACSRTGHCAGPTAAAVRAVTDAGRHAGDLVVCDVSRFPGAATETVLELADLVVLVVPATVRACIAAGKVSQWITERNPNQGLVVRGPAPGGLRGADVAEVLDLPLIASMRAERALTGMLEHGGLRPGRRSPLGAAAEAVLDTVGSRPRSREWAA
ncbi:CpaE-like family protein [Rhodococcus opacus]|uniref:CpaE-like family protein n=1 Tax=Rhodococcus opacus TaxID=37919 RepID=A0AAX3YJ72_RHOOP|nr:septum site-determining protein Ssd [Rhodococcus opacus]MCZ4583824.1 CpaE-like family protein [Rhodococcus opacus]WLF48037.1 CpaE-like family protein [Rhodococcus opacus]